MQKFYKQRIYKKYNDEIWGSLITSKKFSYNKKAVLLNYKDISVRGRFKLTTRYRYFRRGFLKRLNYTIFNFKFSRRVFRLFNFFKRKTWLYNTSNISTIILRPDFKMRWKKRWYFRKHGMHFFYFKRKKSVAKLKYLFYSLIRFKRFSMLKPKLFVLRINVGRSLFLTSRFPAVFVKRSLVWRNFDKFAKINNLRFIIRKKLNLRREKSFFYSVHVASPRKKRKKWSLFGLKNIYYKKLALFFGFKKVADFFKVYNSVSTIWGRNQSAFFLALECRLENLLYRLNYFPSIYFIKKFILSGNVFVNNKVINYPSYVLVPGDIISINKTFFKLIYSSLRSRLSSKKVLLNSPAFVEIDYKLLVALLIRSPSVSDLTMPVSFDLYTQPLSFNR